jgi:hypothetical protein
MSFRKLLEACDGLCLTHEVARFRTRRVWLPSPWLMLFPIYNSNWSYQSCLRCTLRSRIECEAGGTPDEISRMLLSMRALHSRSGLELPQRDECMRATIRSLFVVYVVFVLDNRGRSLET